MLTQVGERFEFTLGRKHIEPFAFCWPAAKRDYALVDEIEDWLVENEIDPSIRYDHTDTDYDLVQYFLIFDSAPEALFFLLRWA